jgi:hypothetical protein
MRVTWPLALIALLACKHAGALPFQVMFETDANASGGSELAFNTYPTFTDLLQGTNGTSQFSTIDVSAPFSTTGLLYEPDSNTGSGTGTGSGTVSEPTPIALLGLGLAGIGFLRRMKKARNAG